jgi:hypothetical protein
VFEFVASDVVVLWDGRLDEPKVRAIAETLADVADDHAKRAVAVVLPEAPELPVMASRPRRPTPVLARHDPSGPASGPHPAYSCR